MKPRRMRAARWPVGPALAALALALAAAAPGTQDPAAAAVPGSQDVAAAADTTAVGASAATGEVATAGGPSSSEADRRAKVRALLNGKYLDCHAHTAGIGAGGSGIYVGRSLRESWKFDIYLKAFLVSEEELDRHGDGLVMERLSARLAESRTVGAAVVLALDGPVDSAGNLDSARTELYVPGDFVARETRKYPNLLYGASINPKRPDAVARLRQAKADGAVLVKWLPSIMHFDPSDTAFAPFYLALKELDLPLLTHAGKESSFHSATDSLCDPRRLQLPILLGVKVIVAHVATPGKNHGEQNHERLLSMFAGNPNLYSDISSLTQINKLSLLQKILPRPEAGGRLVFGSDWPLINTALVSSWYYVHKLGLGKVREISSIDNPWDRSVALKKALGVPEDVFRRTETVLLGDPNTARKSGQ